MIPRYCLLGLLALSACGPTAPGRDGMAVEVSRGAGPADANPNACYARQTTPAVIETVTDQIMIQPPQIDSAGRVLEPGVFVTETRQRILRDRQETWFETPCQIEAGDPDFIASLQRALAARGHYRGPVNGVMDGRTERAVQAYQATQGLDSSVLSLDTARALGLSVWDPIAAAGGSAG